MKLLYVFRQRRSAIARVFFACAAGYFAYAFFTTHEYTAVAQVQGYVPGGASLPAGGQDDFRANVRIIESTETVQNVVEKLSDNDRQRLLAPFTRVFRLGSAPSVAQILYQRRAVKSGPSAMIIDVAFQHPDPAAAALVANALADEFIKQHDALNEEKVQRMIGDLQARADKQQTELASIQSRMDELIKKYGGSALANASADVYSGAIHDLNQKVIDTNAALDELKLESQQIHDQVAADKPVWELKFIASQPRVITLLGYYQQELDKVQQLRNDAFTEDSQNMVEAKGRADGAVKQLNDALNTVVQQLLANLDSKQHEYDQAVSRLAEMTKQNQELARSRIEYQSLHDEYDTAQKLHSAQVVDISSAQTKAKLNSVNYSVIARAEPPASPDPKPWAAMSLASLGWGLGGGLLALAGFAVFLPPPAAQHEEYERRRRRHRHFHSSSASSSHRRSREK